MRRRVIIVAACVVVAAAAFAVYWFEPQALFLDDKVDEAVPVAASANTTTAPAGAGNGSEQAPTTAPPEPVELASGTLRGIEGHDVRSGRAVVLELADGRRFLRLEDLDAENGPDLKVYLSAAPEEADPDAHDDDYVSLGGLRGNVGSSNYEIPGDLDLRRFRSAVIWCERFSVGFAVADVTTGSARG